MFYWFSISPCSMYRFPIGVVYPAAESARKKTSLSLYKPARQQQRQQPRCGCFVHAAATHYNTGHRQHHRSRRRCRHGHCRRRRCRSPAPVPPFDFHLRLAHFVCQQSEVMCKVLPWGNEASFLPLLPPAHCCKCYRIALQ